MASVHRVDAGIKVRVVSLYAVDTFEVTFSCQGSAEELDDLSRSTGGLKHKSLPLGQTKQVELSHEESKK